MKSCYLRSCLFYNDPISNAQYFDISKRKKNVSNLEGVVRLVHFYVWYYVYFFTRKRLLRECLPFCAYVCRSLLLQLFWVLPRFSLTRAICANLIFEANCGLFLSYIVLRKHSFFIFLNMKSFNVSIDIISWNACDYPHGG